MPANAPGLAQLRMICSSFQSITKIVKKGLVFINHQNGNCSQTNVSGQELCHGKLMCMKHAFLLDLQDLKDAFNSPFRQKFPNLGIIIFSFNTF